MGFQLFTSVLKTMAKECPKLDPQGNKHTFYGKDLYCAFTKVNAAIGHARSTETYDGEDVECQVAKRMISVFQPRDFRVTPLREPLSSGWLCTSCSGPARIN